MCNGGQIPMVWPGHSYDVTVTRRPLVTLFAVATGLAFSGCAEPDSGQLDVLAASSFTDVAVPLEALVEGELDVDIRFSFGSSGTFSEQLRQGAPASVVITANTSTMTLIDEAGLIEPPVDLAANQLVIVTADSEQGRAVESFDDLVDGDVQLVVCAESAPCGQATSRLEQLRDVELAPVSREPNVRSTLTKVLLGEADAAIVYRTDGLAHPTLRVVEIEPETVEVVGQVAAVEGHAMGADIVDVLTGDEARAILADAGFVVL